MKNLKRIVLLIALVLIAGKVLFSDYNFIKPENNTIATASK